MKTNIISSKMMKLCWFSLFLYCCFTYYYCKADADADLKSIYPSDNGSSDYPSDVASTFVPTTTSDNDDGGVYTLQSIVRTIDELSIYSKYLDMDNFMDIGNTTVFAPIDNAFKNSNQTLLNNIINLSWIHESAFLTCNIIQGKYYIEDLYDGQVLYPYSYSCGNITVIMNKDNEVFLESMYSNRSTIIESNIEASDSIIHTVDTVNKPSFFNKNLISILKEYDNNNNNEFSIFIELIELIPNIKNILSTGDYTIFAPNNNSFNIFYSTINKMNYIKDPKNIKELKRIILYHIVPTSIIMYENDTIILKSLSGDNLQIYNSFTKKGVLNINNDNNEIYESNIMANNGFLHIISEVLNVNNIVQLFN